jgi:hypothetical protein
MHARMIHVRLRWCLAGISVLLLILSCASPESASREEPVHRYTIPVREETATLTIHSLRTEPSVLVPGKSFDLVVDYSVDDPAAGMATIMTRVRYCIYKGAVRTYTSKPVTIPGTQGTVIRKRVRLEAPADPGAYIAKAFVYYGIMRISETVAFEVENGQ